MNRRDFFRRSALIAAGGAMAYELDRLGWVRKFFPSAWPSAAGYRAQPIHRLSLRNWDALLQEAYVTEKFKSAMYESTPFGSLLWQSSPEPVRLIRA